MNDKEFISDDSWLWAFLFYNGVAPSFQTRGGRVYACCPHSSQLDQLILAYNGNCDVKVHDFVRSAKTLRGRMMSAKKSAIL
jgi:hypothetical protein